MNYELIDQYLSPKAVEMAQQACHEAAYFNWLNAGCPEGRDLEFWLAGEEEIYGPPWWNLSEIEMDTNWDLAVNCEIMGK